MRAFSKMFKTELRLSIRDMNMVMFAVIMPLVILVILGIIYGEKPAGDGAGYTCIEQSFGALCSIAICGGGAMGLPIMISEYRERKILKRFQVTPVSPLFLLLVHYVIYTLYALVSMLLLWVFAAAFWHMEIHGSLLGFLGSWLITLLCLFSIGTLVGGLAKNSKQAGMVASLLYFPMLIFSGATLPYEKMPVGLQKAADLMPLTQGIKLMKATSLGEPMENVGVSLLLPVVLTLVCFAAALRFFKWE